MRSRVDEELTPVEKIVEELKSSSRNVGAVIVFVGVVREASNNKKVKKLVYEAHKDLAKETLERYSQTVKEKYGVIDVVAEHRMGELSVGEETMVLGVASAHRSEGFAAIVELLERIKSGIPIWKKEVFENGNSRWITAHKSSLMLVVDGEPVNIKDPEALITDVKEVIERHVGLKGKTIFLWVSE